MSNIYRKLWEYSKSDYYGFHMPGHKRNECLTGSELPYGIDITEIEGFDDLHHPKGLIQEAEKRAAILYQAEETHYLINGSTAGILSGILGCTSRGDKVLIARNCHRSVYHAIYLNALYPVYVYPRFSQSIELSGAVYAADIEQALEQEENVKAVVITSPTYDGVVSDIEAIAQTTHARGIPLIVDEAHGAHFGFHSYFPQNANIRGADVVIHSLHKTLPALTQTALIHMNGNLAPRREIRQYLQMFQTSSPSYVLMASIDACIHMLDTKGQEHFQKYTDILEKGRQRLSALQHLKLMETKEFDKSKLIISVKSANITGRELYNRLLQKYHLQLEMAADTYVLAMTSIGDTQEGINRFTDALIEIDSQLSETDMNVGKYVLPVLKQRYTSAETEKRRRSKQVGKIHEKMTSPTKVLEWEKAVGKITVEYAYIYPPGIPLFVPGEELSKEAVELLNSYKTLGFIIEGLKNEGKVEVLEIG